MKRNSSPYLRALYIVLVPIVLLIILLNSGLLQRLLPAATVHGETYSVVRYNFYYYDYYNNFLEENEDQLDELGYDPSESASKQYYDISTTWKEFFQRQAEAVLTETAYYYDLAVAAGYTFSEEELAPIQEQLDKNDAERSLYSISASNYYLSYYGSGMNQTRYVEELTRKVKAQAYQAYLVEQNQPTQDEIDSWLAENPEEEYQTADLRVITLEAMTDRVTGEMGSDQLSALSEKANRLWKLYQEGKTFEQLQAAYSTCALGNEIGAITTATKQDLPQCLSDWCFQNQDSLSVGDVYQVMDESVGVSYFAILDGFGTSGPEQDAIRALSESNIAQAAQDEADEYSVARNSIGMLLAAA